MKLSKEEWAEIAHIKKSNQTIIPGKQQLHIEYLLQCLEKLQKPKPERFTYGYTICIMCDGSGGRFEQDNRMTDTPCSNCGGLGQVRVKVKRTVHSV